MTAQPRQPPIPPCTEPIDVGVGVALDRQGPACRVLVTRRPVGTLYGDWWELPGGKLEPDETPAQAVVRELFEELGVRVAIEAPLAVVEHVYAHGHVRLHPFFCRIVEGRPQNLAVAEHRWLRPDQLADYRFLPANTPLIAEIQHRLTTPGE